MIAVSTLHLIATATKVNILQRLIFSAASAPCISESQTHLLTIIHTAQFSCTRTLVPGRAGMEYMLPGTQGFLDWCMEQAFIILTC